MKKFKDLSKGEKRCVLALFETEPKLKGNKKVQRKHIVSAWEALKSKGSKVGYPNWLLSKDYKNDKGFYVLPVPTPKDLELYLNPPKKPKPKQTTKKVTNKKGESVLRKEFNSQSLSEEDMEYYSTLNKYGIPF